MRKVILLVALVVAMASGCASYTVQNVPSQLDENKVVKGGDNDISITAFPILTEEDSKKYFDDDLTAKNVLPVYLVIVNHSQMPVQLISLQLDTGGNDKIEPYPQKEIYKLVRREYAGKSSFWVLITYGVGGPISAAHTANVNSKIEEDIDKKTLNFGEIKPKAFQQGFVWFKLPDDIALEENGDRGFVLKLSLQKDGKSAEYNLPIKK